MKIKLTEADLKNVINESVKKILNERTKNEQGLTDDEVSRKRTLNFANNVNPYYSDSIYNDEQDNYMDKMYALRKQHHNATQNHKSKIQETFDLDKFRGQRQESDLHRVIKESVNKVLKENLYGLTHLQGRELFDTITSHLQHLGDVRVANFYSDDYNIIIAMHKSVRGKRKEIDEIMKGFGYTLYDSGANDDYIMLTYKKSR